MDERGSACVYIGKYILIELHVCKYENFTCVCKGGQQGCFTASHIVVSSFCSGEKGSG